MNVYMNKNVQGVVMVQEDNLMGTMPMSNVPLLNSTPLMPGNRFLDKCESFGESVPHRATLNGASRSGLHNGGMQDCLPLGHRGLAGTYDPNDPTSRCRTHAYLSHCACVCEPERGKEREGEGDGEDRMGGRGQPERGR
jgi:hypothetical protein